MPDPGESLRNRLLPAELAREPNREVDDRLDPQSVQAIVAGLITTAVQYVDEELSPDRAKATDYYQARPFGNEESGRSQVVSADVRDAILRIMPSMLRIFFGPNGCVEYVAKTADKEAEAKLATGYANAIFLDDNDGFLLTHSVLKDGLLKKLGVAKVWWEEISSSTTYHLTGLTQESMALLQMEPGVSFGDVRQRMPMPGGPPVYDCDVTRSLMDGRCRVAALPPEELVFNRDARNDQVALLMGHRRDATISELVALGFDKEAVESLAGPSDLTDNVEELSRNPKTGLSRHEEISDDSTRTVPYCEAYVRIDINDDDIAELRRFHAFGPGWKLLSRNGADPEAGEPVDEAPFVLYVMDPEPHTILGMSMYDYVADIQKIKSNISRGMLDSLNLTLHPRTWAVMGQAEAQDVLNTEIGAIIRVKQAGMVGEFAHQFVGKEAMPVLDLFDQVMESRTGTSKASAGLDADALQSSTKMAVAGTFSAAQERKELLARIFAETFMKDLFTKILKLVKTHQQQPRDLKIRNQYVTVDPRTWGDMGVRVTVALGAGMTEEKVANLLAIKQDQDMVLGQFGLANPLVNLAQARNTRARLLELQGFPNPDEFYNPITDEQAKVFAQQAAAQPPKKTPEETVAEAQANQIQTNLQIAVERLALDKQKAELDRQTAIWDHELKLMQMREELALKSRELELEYAASIDEAKMQQFIEGHKAALDHMQEQYKTELKAQSEMFKAELQAKATTGAKRARKVKVQRGKDGQVVGLEVSESGDQPKT
jgi:hypothetical protein